MTNVLPHRYREVSLARVDEPLTPEALRHHFLGREAYRRTRYIIARHGEAVALVAVDTASRTPLFAPITQVTVLAAPDECAVLEAPTVDCDVPNQLARVAEERAPGKRCVIVHGRYDLCTPASTAWELHKAWPRADYRIVPDSGHAMTEPGIVHELVTATERFKTA